MNTKPKFTKDEFLKYQNSKFKVRRSIALFTGFAYFGIVVYMLWRIPPEHFDQYDNFFMMLTSFATGIVMSYFAGSSYEETRINRQDLVDEFTTLHQRNDDARDRRDYRRSQRRNIQDEPMDNEQEVPGNPSSASQQNDNEVG
ncbi:hypothetical protein PP940_gp042 [Rhizobium phage RL2RES]|uniref:Uncharacterized protein n=1 Tax=Rhizobium phage RL2RES TaxID=103371 RepID=A0A6B9J385_9CAUD|nr:hypothetical protein PP940_gp042 [Rhizobium phage RL2RES]QGZ14203.1 hypothetical protein RL2RES_042 [Rhizobium phage RL2RES]